MEKTGGTSREVDAVNWFAEEIRRFPEPAGLLNAIRRGVVRWPARIDAAQAARGCARERMIFEDLEDICDKVPI